MRLVLVVAALCRYGFGRFIVVDDGSDEGHQQPFRELEARGIAVLRHPQNLGKGMAIKTALARLTRLFPEASAYVTVDGDGQHLPADVRRVCKKAQAHPGEIVIGTRNLEAAGVPLRSRLGNKFSAAFFKMDTGLACADTQTGLRCVPVSLLPFAQSVPGMRYDYEMNMLTQVVKSGMQVNMVPITTVYEDNNAGSHFRAVRDSVLIYRQPLRFAASSVTCAALDLGLFALLVATLTLEPALLVGASAMVARLFSGGANFLLNRTFSFSADGSRQGRMKGQALRYAILFSMVMMTSATLTTVLSAAGLPAVLAKVVVDSCLFVVNFFAQRNWVFAKGAEGASGPDTSNRIQNRTNNGIEGGKHVRSSNGAGYRIQAG